MAGMAGPLSVQTLTLAQTQLMLITSQVARQAHTCRCEYPPSTCLSKQISRLFHLHQGK